MSSVLAALTAVERSDLRQRMEGELAALEETSRMATEELRQIDLAWDRRDHALAGRLVVLQQEFAYLGKWQAQLREDLFQLGG